MSDSKICANPRLIYFAVNKDQKWKQVTLQSFLQETTTDDILEAHRNVVTSEHLDAEDAEYDEISKGRRKILQNMCKDPYYTFHSELSRGLCSDARRYLKMRLQFGNFDFTTEDPFRLESLRKSR